MSFVSGYVEKRIRKNVTLTSFDQFTAVFPSICTFNAFENQYNQRLVTLSVPFVYEPFRADNRESFLAFGSVAIFESSSNRFAMPENRVATYAADNQTLTRKNRIKNLFQFIRANARKKE